MSCTSVKDILPDRNALGPDAANPSESLNIMSVLHCYKVATIRLTVVRNLLIVLDRLEVQYTSVTDLRSCDMVSLQSR